MNATSDQEEDSEEVEKNNVEVQKANVLKFVSLAGTIRFECSAMDLRTGPVTFWRSE